MADPRVEGDLRMEQIRRLTAVSRELTYATSVEAVVQLAVRRAEDLLGASRAVLMATDPDGLLRVRATRGVEPDIVEELREPIEETLALRLRLLMAAGGNEPFLGVPLVARGEVIGLLAVARPGGEPFGDQDEWSLSALADQAAVALATMRADEKVREVVEERKRAMEGDVQGAREQNQALASLGHELRSPLHAIESYAQLLRLGIPGELNEEQVRAVERIRMAGQHLSSLVDRMLEMARLEAGELELDPAPVPIVHVIEEAVDIARPGVRPHQTLEIEDLPHLVVLADPNRIRQVLVNLIDNAIKFTRDRGRVSVGAHAGRLSDGPCCMITVTDDGPGIPLEEQERIFRPYYRLSGTTTWGAGLGLAISRQLVRQMGGDIDVESEVGHRSTFRVRLPLVEPPS